MWLFILFTGQIRVWLIHLLTQPGEMGSWAPRPGPPGGWALCGQALQQGRWGRGVSLGVAQLPLSWRLGL